MEYQRTCTGCGAPFTTTRQTNTVCSPECRYTSRRKVITEPGPNPSGLCQCGCGEPTLLARKTDRAANTVKGKPTRFLIGHNVSPPLDPEWIAEDRCFETPCHVWRGGTTRNGYPVRAGKGKRGQHQPTLAHRAAFERSGGTIPDGTEIHHRCGNRLCVNPDHLEALPIGEHRRMHIAQRRAVV